MENKIIMSEKTMQLTEKEEELITFLRRNNSVQAVTAAWALLKYSIELDNEVLRLKNTETPSPPEVIVDLKARSRGLKLLSQLMGGN